MHVVDEAPHRNVFRDPGMGFHPFDVLNRVGLDIAERVELLGFNGEMSGKRLQLRGQLIALEQRHTAIRVVDDHDLFGSENTSRHDEGSDDIRRDGGTRISDDVRIFGT